MSEIDHIHTSGSVIADEALPPNDDLYTPSNLDYNTLIYRRRNVQYGLTDLQAMVNLIKGLVGTGILSLPLAFYNSGLWTGLVLTVIIVVINVHGMHLLVQASHQLCIELDKASLDYAEVAEFTVAQFLQRYSKWQLAARYTVNGFLFATQLGFCCVYFVFMAQNILQVINHYSGTDIAVYWYIAMLLVPVGLLVQIRHLRHLAPLSMLSNVLYLVGFVIVFSYLFQDIPDYTELPSFNSFGTLPLYFGAVMFSFEGISLVLPIENRMFKPQNYLPWNGVLNTACGMVCALYCAVGFFGYLKFGASVQEGGTITLNLPKDNILYQSTKLIFAVAVFFTYAVQFYVPIDLCRQILQRRFFDREKLASLLEIVIRVMLVVLTFGLAELIPHVGLFISLVGSMTGAALAFIFPPLIDTVSRVKSRDFGMFYWKLIKNVVIVVAGVLGFATGTYSSMVDIVKTF